MKLFIIYVFLFLLALKGCTHFLFLKMFNNMLLNLGFLSMLIDSDQMRKIKTIQLQFHSWNMKFMSCILIFFKTNILLKNHETCSCLSNRLHKIKQITNDRWLLHNWHKFKCVYKKWIKVYRSSIVVTLNKWKKNILFFEIVLIKFYLDPWSSKLNI